MEVFTPKPLVSIWTILQMEVFNRKASCLSEPSKCMSASHVSNSRTMFVSSVLLLRIESQVPVTVHFHVTIYSARFEVQSYSTTFLVDHTESKRSVLQSVS